VTGSYDSNVLGERFQLAAPPTALARSASMAPIGFSRLKSSGVDYLRAKDVPAEHAFALHVALEPTKIDLWIDGKHAISSAPKPGEAFLFDLASNPVSEFHASFDVMRFYISRASIDELAYERGIRGPIRLMPRLGMPDRTMHGLATALLDSVERANERSALFIDHIGLAFHAHLIEAYAGRTRPIDRKRGGLAAWQLRRAIQFMTDRLDGDPTIADLAQECGLSHAYFARAFRRSAGVTPHQWLMRRRIARARTLLLAGDMDLAAVAAMCGFVDQSHLSRVFARFEGDAPGRWRARHR
jgi:AraC-like DNA-binding protein